MQYSIVMAYLLYGARGCRLVILVNPTTLVLPTVESIDRDTSLIRTLSRVLAG